MALRDLRNPIPEIIAPEYHRSLVYGEVLYGLHFHQETLANKARAYNAVVMGDFLNRCHRRWTFKSEMLERFVPNAVH